MNKVYYLRYKAPKLQPISEMILRGDVHEGQNIAVNLENDNLKFDVN